MQTDLKADALMGLFARFAVILLEFITQVL